MGAHLGKIRVTIKGGKVAFGRSLLAEKIRGADDGDYDIIIKKATTGSSRYAYYFDAVMYDLLMQAGHHFRFSGGAPIETEEQLHTVMKMLYNPTNIVDPNTGEVFKTPMSTTGMTDRDFIQEFEQQIIADFSQPPYNVEFISFDQWVESRTKGTWNERKHHLAIEAARIRSSIGQN